ncbi:MAG: hypothetical protein WCY19_07270 [Candidatus Gastranaerophilaceae bacterium]
MNNKAVILHNKISDNPTTDELDVLDQVKDVNEALIQLGYETAIVPFSFDLSRVIEELKKENPKFVFNLVEGIDNDGQLITIAPAILDYLKIPYTGCTKESMFLTSNKVLTKKIMKANSIPTAEWVTTDNEKDNVFLDGERYIVKAIWEDASIGLDNEAVVSPISEEDLINLIKAKNEKYKIEFFAERYIHGRDFTISVVAGKQMPVCEVTFFGYYDDDRVRVFDYNAKWVKDTPEYDNTDIEFEFEGIDSVIEKMQKIAHDCWNIFNLKGYARVDFRVDEKGNPFVLEINPNPCISRGIMFDKMMQEGKVDYVDGIKAIIDDMKVIY